MDLVALYRQIDPDLKYVEQELEKNLKSSQPELQDAATHLLAAGGKRLRPVFVLLSGRLGHYDLERLSRVAVALELIHMATLVHDDVVDDSDRRRGNPTVKSQFGNRMAMYTGDFMFAQGLSVLSELPDPRIHRIFSRAIERMCIGEIEQIRDLHSFDQSVYCYLRRIRRKTALLIQMACTMGALAADADSLIVTALRRFGYYTGMAFQIIDDVLDFTSTEKTLGKPVGSDLRQGNVTLPVIYAMDHAGIKQQLQLLLGSGHTEADEDRAIALVNNSDGIERAQCLAERFLLKASDALALLPAVPARTSLTALAKFIGQRDH